MAKLGAPYIGVTGFTNPDEVHRQLMWLADTHQNRLEDRPMMVGVLVNRSTLHPIPIHHRYVRYPSIETVKPIFEQASDQGDRMTFRVVHYDTPDQDTLKQQLLRLYAASGRSGIVESIQLNMDWPDPRQLEDMLTYYRRIILVVGHKPIVQMTNEEIASRVCAYDGLVTDVLLDPSEGAGQLADFDRLRAMLHTVRELNPSLGLGVAGGLSAENVLTQLPRLFREFPKLSVDAEGLLRTDDGASLDTTKTHDYVVNTFEALRLSRVE